MFFQNFDDVDNFFELSRISYDLLSRVSDVTAMSDGRDQPAAFSAHGCLTGIGDDEGTLRFRFSAASGPLGGEGILIGELSDATGSLPISSLIV